METINTPRIPLEYNGFQFNFCKNPKCKNFGIPASQEKKYGGNTYTLTGGNRANGTTNIPLLKCNGCGEHLPMKSNQGIHNELDRISAYLAIIRKEVCCSNHECTNHTVPVGTKKAYRAYGTAASGAKRYRCNACGITVSVAKPTQGQHETHQNIEIFKLLVNKVPLNRIINILGISWNVLYNRINFIHCQCLAFASNRENKLKDMSLSRLYLSIDRQDHSINWTERKDKRNIVLSAITSGDNTTGYIFGIHPNFDGTKSKEDIEQDVIASSDYDKAPPFRKYAHVWLEKDYSESAKRGLYRRKKPSSTLVEDIENTYEATANRDDIETFDNKSTTEKLPDYGVQVHAEYTMFAHFLFLKNLLPNVDKWRFFLDQDSGIRSAFMASFADEVIAKKAEAFYVRIEKEMTVDEKRKLKAQAKKKFDEVVERNRNLSENEVKIELLKEEIQSVLKLGNWQDSWVKHPFPSMAEANKAMCWLTEHDEFDLTHKAWLFNKASLHGVDSFFQKVRRRIAMLERPIASSSNNGRVWNGYGAYNPSMVVKMLEIFRVVHNYIDIKKEKVKIDGVEKTIGTTPAMRLGLAQAPIDYKDVLYYE